MFCALHTSFPLCAPLYVFCILHSSHFHSTCALQSLLHYSLFYRAILIFSLHFKNICSMFHLFKVTMFTSSYWQWCFALYTFHFHYMCVSSCALCYSFQPLFSFSSFVMWFASFIVIALIFLCFLLLQVFGFNCWSSSPSRLFCSITSFSFVFVYICSTFVGCWYCKVATCVHFYFLALQFNCFCFFIKLLH